MTDGSLGSRRQSREAALLSDGEVSVACVLPGDVCVFHSACLHFASNGADELSAALFHGIVTAAALPRLREQLNIQTCLTALAELPASLQASVQGSGVKHVWCNVRDVEEADGVELKGLLSAEGTSAEDESVGEPSDR